MSPTATPSANASAVSAINVARTSESSLSIAHPLNIISLYSHSAANPMRYKIHVLVSMMSP